MLSRLLRYLPRRFSLRTALIVVTLLCVFLGVIYPRIQRVNDVHTFRRYGFDVVFSGQSDANEGKPPSYSLARRIDSWVGDGFARDVQEVVQRSETERKVVKPTRDEFIELLIALEKYPYEPLGLVIHIGSPDDVEAYRRALGSKAIKIIFFSGSSISQEAAELFSSFPNLEMMLVNLIRSDDLGLKNLAKLSRLGSLQIEVSRDSADRDFKGLGEAFSCRHLLLQNFQLNESSIEQIGRIKDLESLGLFFDELNDEQLKQLATCNPNLTQLKLQSYELTDACWSHIGGLSRLEELVIHACPFTNKGIMSGFPKMRHLKKIGFTGDDFSPEIVPILAERCPVLETVIINRERFLRNAKGEWVPENELADSPSE